ncbi:MAG TPA: dTDP-4-dehydrorhamnose reductase, partial [Candidatus Cybelea sp.]|nr:dTDP-4-dehydrorhamnose reductase [Candidatus Cybelea sp.]
MTRVLLIGGSGRLGTAIRRQWSDCEIAAPPHDELDIADASAVRSALDGFAPDVFVNAAAFHDVDRCEDEPERALAINAAAVGSAARYARDRGAVFVTLSTDYVFDGAAREPYGEESAPHPISFYGVSKLAGEYLVESLRTSAYVVRTCGLYGAAGSRKRPSLIDRVLESKSGGAPLRVVGDVVASPTFAGDLADALRRLIATQSYGLYHAVNSGPVSWYDFACEAARQAGVENAIEQIPAE